MPTRFAELLEQLQQRCLGMGGMALGAVREAVAGVVTRDQNAARAAMEGEAAIDAEEVEIEKQAINLLALHQPAAGDLRTVFAVVKINGDLERMADCAVNIAQQAAAVAGSGVEIPRDLRIMAESVLKQFADALQCLATKDAALADQVCRGDDVIDALYHQLLQELQGRMAKDPQGVAGDLALVMVARNLERIGDHCTNIAEDVVYRMQGRIVRHSHDPR